MTILKDADRTCSIFIGIGDTTTNEFEIAWYSHENVTVFTDESYPQYQGHPRMEDVLYIDKFNQPSHDPCLGALLQAGYGNITSEYLYREVAPKLQTGSLHVAIYDFKYKMMYVSNAAKWIPDKTQEKGYDRSFIQLNMEDIFNEQI